MTDTSDTSHPGNRLAKIMARAGLCSRRDAEDWIKGGRVAVNGKTILTPAFNVTEADQIAVDGAPLQPQAGTRVWLYYKPRGLVVTEKDPEGRPTIFDTLAEQGLPRVVSVGRLDINTEGLLLLTNDGGLKRVLELPATGWLRKYRVRAFGSVTQAQLDGLKQGITVEGVSYGPIEATLERDQGSNVWLEVALREGKNREVKNVLAVLGLEVNRLIRVSYGPFQLGDLPVGAIEVVRARVLKDQLGRKLAKEAGVDFDSEMPEAQRPVAADAGTGEKRRARSFEDGKSGAGRRPFGKADATRPGGRAGGKYPPRGEHSGFDRPRGGGFREAAPRRIHFDDGRPSEIYEEKPSGRPARDTGTVGKAAGFKRAGGPPDRAPRAKSRPDNGNRGSGRSAGYREASSPRGDSRDRSDARPDTRDRHRTGKPGPGGPSARPSRAPNHSRSEGAETDRPAPRGKRPFGGKPVGAAPGPKRGPRGTDSARPRSGAAPATGKPGKFGGAGRSGSRPPRPAGSRPSTGPRPPRKTGAPRRPRGEN